MFGVRMEIDARAFMSHMNSGAQQFTTLATQAMERYTEDLLLMTKPDVPIKDGTLRNSGKKVVVAGPGLIEGIVNFSANAPNGYNYAKIQSDRCDFNHPKGGKCKYLEDNVKKSQDRLGGYVVGALNASFR